MTDVRNARHSVRVAVVTPGAVRNYRHSVRVAIDPLTPEPTGVDVKAWTGSVFATAPLEVWSGSAFVDAVARQDVERVGVRVIERAVGA